MTVLRNVFTKTLWDQRRALLGWAVGLAGVSLVYAGFYPSVNQPAFAEAMANFPPALMETFGWAGIVSAEGYLGSTVLGLLAPVLTIILAAATGARAIAGDEEAGTLELVLTYPVGRTSVLLHRAAALVVVMLLAGGVVLLALLAVSGPAELDILASRLAAASAQLSLLGICFGTLALAVGALIGRRAVALAVTAVAAVAAYLGNTLARQVDALSWLEPLSPFRYYSGGEPLRNGFQAGDAAILAVISLVLVTIGAFAFSRRDVAV